tara:strand:- start:125 stop:649 length:525 start_codon:yes stop_codon:yes gene_type:complete
LATRKELAEHLGLSPQSINDLIRNNVITIGSGRSPVNIDACRLQYLNYLRKAARYTKKDGTADIAEEKARLTKAQADKAELEVSELEAKLIPAELVADTWIDYVANVRAKLLGLPSRIAHQVLTLDKYSEVEEVIKEQVYDSLQELADDGIPTQYRKSITKNKKDLDASTKSKN